MSTVPEHLRNKPFILIATLGLAPGKEERAKELLAAVHQRANSSAEPGTLTYRFNISPDGKTVIAFEEYANAAAHKAHATSDVFKKFNAAAAKEQIFTKFEVKFYEEIKFAKL